MMILFCPALRRLYPGPYIPFAEHVEDRNQQGAARTARASYAWTGARRYGLKIYCQLCVRNQLR
jgi:hypothetical protein